MADIRTELVGLVRTQAQLDHDPDIHSNLVTEAGIDSLMALRILAAIERNYDLRIPDDQLAQMTSVDSIASFIEQAKKA